MLAHQNRLSSIVVAAAIASLSEGTTPVCEEVGLARANTGRALPHVGEHRLIASWAHAVRWHDYLSEGFRLPIVDEHLYLVIIFQADHFILVEDAALLDKGSTEGEARRKQCNIVDTAEAE